MERIPSTSAATNGASRNRVARDALVSQRAGVDDSMFALAYNAPG